MDNDRLDHPFVGKEKMLNSNIKLTFPLILGEMKSEQVLNLELLPVQETKFDGETTEQRCQWTVQRIRLSPQEKHLAATIKSHHCAEPR